MKGKKQELTAVFKPLDVSSKPTAATEIIEHLQPAPVSKPENTHRQSVESASFEKALDRVRVASSVPASQNVSMQQNDAAPVDSTLAVEPPEKAAEIDYLNNHSVRDVIVEPESSIQYSQPPTDGLLQSTANTAGESVDQTVQAQAITTSVMPASEQNIVSRSHTDYSRSDSFAVSSTNEGVSFGVSLGETAGIAAPAVPTARFTHNATQQISDMMQRIDRMPGKSSGQWSLGVVDSSSGIVGLQLQREQSGGWRVNVSLTETAMADAQEGTDKLKAALVKEGHDIESISLSQDQYEDGDGYG